MKNSEYYAIGYFESISCKYLAQKYNGELVDFQGMYDEFCKYKHSSIIAWDRVHPNQMGATLMAKEFLKHCDFDFSI